MNFKNILSVAAAAVVVGVNWAVTMRNAKAFSIKALAADIFTEGTYGDLIYRKYGDHIEILGCDYSAVNVDIPSKIDGLPVTVIGEYAFYHFPEEYDPYENSLVSVSIPDSVTIIGVGAFSNCSKLSSINIPDSVTVIGKSAFAGCYRLTEINIPESLTGISELSFFDCSGLTEITIPEGVKYIGDHAFMGCDDLLSVTIPDSMASIGYGAFWECNSLTSVTVPKSVTSIGKDAFGSCESLTKVTILNPICSITGLATISNFAYYKDDAVYGDFYGTIRGYEGSTTQAYAEKYYYNFESLGKSPVWLGDIDYNGAIDAVDASMTLTAYAKLSTNQKTGLTDIQLAAADVNNDGAVDAVDASLILSYYAYVSTNGTDSFEDFLNSRI